MKIVFIGGRDIHILGGIENYMYNLATELVKLGHEPIVYCESDHNGKEIVNGFEVRYVKAPKSNLICKPLVGLIATLRTVFKEKNVGLIHYNAWPPALWSWIPKLFGIKSLMEGHGLEWKRSKYSPREQKIVKFMEAFCARHNKNLVMCSMEQVKYYQDTYNKESVWIPGAMNLPENEDGYKSEILNDNKLLPGKYFLFLGRLVQDKNPDYLIRAFVAAGLNGYKLVIAGGNDAMPDYVEMLRGITDSPDVVFTGPVYGDDKDCLLRNAGAFCLPSTIEGLSIVLMEAISFKLPIIASNIEANRELLFDNALYVRPENEADLVIALRNFVEKCVPQAWIDENFNYLAKSFTWSNVALKYNDYICKL